MPSRLERLRARMVELDLPAVLISNDQNRRYLTRFTGSAGHVLVTPTAALLLTDFRYVEQAEDQAAGYTVKKLEDGLIKALPDLLKEIDAGAITVESHVWTVKQYEELTKAAGEAGFSVTAKDDIVEPIRMIKEADEIAALERAIVLADNAVDEVSRALRPGMTEKQVAWEIEKHMREHGAEAMAFEVIVASGPRGAMPHARPTDKIIERGDPIVMDLGCVVDGYHSDLTRTVCFGTPSDEYLEIWGIVREAQRIAADRIRPGMIEKDADALARDFIADVGHGEAFGHSLGHGVGLEIHEGPTLRKTGEGELKEGMVFSVEPGIYLPGKFGVRIEDLVLLEADGCRVLSAAPKLPAYVE